MTRAGAGAAARYGKHDWRVTDDRLVLADVDLYEKMTRPPGRPRGGRPP